jgi:uncharacterized membrane protein affecting hemolysin expression
MVFEARQSRIWLFIAILKILFEGDKFLSLGQEYMQSHFEKQLILSLVQQFTFSSSLYLRSFLDSNFHPFS